MIAGHWPQLTKGHIQLDSDLGSKGQAAYRGVSSGRGFALLESQAPPYFAWLSTYAAYAAYRGVCSELGFAWLESEAPPYLAWLLKHAANYSGVSSGRCPAIGLDSLRPDWLRHSYT